MIIDSIVAEAMILASALEARRGLCDLILALDEVYPSAPLCEKFDAADAAVRSLLKRRWAVLYRAEAKLSGELVDEALRDPRSWHPGPAGARVELAATKSGEKAYQAGELPFPE